ANLPISGSAPRLLGSHFGNPQQPNFLNLFQANKAPVLSSKNAGFNAGANTGAPPPNIFQQLQQAGSITASRLGSSSPGIGHQRVLLPSSTAFPVKAHQSTPQVAKSVTPKGPSTGSRTPMSQQQAYQRHTDMQQADQRRMEQSQFLGNKIDWKAYASVLLKMQ
ncbi:unnamed protein product, partial [Amoebophrya sp. A25]